MGERKPDADTALNTVLGGSIARYLKRFAHACAQVGHPPTIQQTHFLSTSMRRLMTAAWAYETFYGEPLLPFKKMGFKATRKALGRLRDAQVMQETFVRLGVPGCPYADAVMNHLQREARERTAAFSGRFRGLDAAPVDRLRKAMPDALLAKRPSATLPDVRCRLLGDVLALLPEAMVDEEALHAMRVRFKYYRYCNELLAPLIPGMDGARLEGLKALQDAMGAAHDAAVLRDMLGSFDPDVDPGGRDGVRAAAQRVSAAAHADARTVVEPALAQLAEAEAEAVACRGAAGKVDKGDKAGGR